MEIDHKQMGGARDTHDSFGADFTQDHQNMHLKRKWCPQYWSRSLQIGEPATMHKDGPSNRKNAKACNILSQV